VSGAGEAGGEAGGAGPSDGPAPDAPPLEIVYYTDPLCCWSWAFEPHWRRLRAEFGAALDCRYRMAGMIADWGSYSDPLNSVSRPLQMGPIWREAQHLAGVAVDDRIWALDPPASSYPACLAVKAAELQSADAARGGDDATPQHRAPRGAARAGRRARRGGARSAGCGALGS
jgi:protein-disulfide isomerase-like protein with CxxC motif